MTDRSAKRAALLRFCGLLVCTERPGANRGERYARVLVTEHVLRTGGE